MLNPIHLKVLRRVLQDGSFAMAAQHLGYTPSAVSQQILALEHSLDEKLFVRKARGIEPTQVAYFVAERGSNVLGAIEQLQRDLLMFKGVIGPLHIGCFPTAAASLLPGALKSWGRDDVEVTISVAEPNELAAMLTNPAVLDVAVVYKVYPHPRPRGLDVSWCTEDQIVLIMSPDHPLAQKRPLLLADLRAERWICHSPERSRLGGVYRLQELLGFEPLVAAHCNDYIVTMALVSAQIGIALIPELATNAENPSIITRTIDDFAASRSIGTLTRDTANSIAQSFARHLRTYLDVDPRAL